VASESKAITLWERPTEQLAEKRVRTKRREGAHSVACNQEEICVCQAGNEKKLRLGDSPYLDKARDISDSNGTD
jgi:hypothetical protein